MKTRGRSSAEGVWSFVSHPVQSLHPSAVSILPSLTISDADSIHPVKLGTEQQGCNTEAKLEAHEL